MIRRLAVLLVAVALAAGCGGESSEPSPTPKGPGGRPTARGGFLLEVGPGAVPGRPPPVQVTGDSTGVTVTVRRADEPIELFDRIQDLRALGEIEVDSLEEVAAASAVGGAELRLPKLPGGLYLVEAARGEQRTLALLPVSDLVLVTKRSRDEVLVFVADAKTGAPIPRARVVVAGPSGREEGVSDAQGVFRRSVDPGPRARVLALAGDRVAVATPEHYPAVADGPIAYVYTDRPAYRPGETVHVKCIHRLRGRAGYRSGSTEGATFRVVDARDNEVAAGEAAAHGAGTCWASFTLPEAAALGTARIEVRIGKRAFQGEILVEEFVRPSFEVKVLASAPRVVWGDEVSFTVRAAYYSGGVLAGAKVRYRIHPTVFGDSTSDDLAGEAILDARGEFRTLLERTEYLEYGFSAEVTDRAGTTARDEVRVQVAPAEFSLEIETDRRHYAPGHAEAIVSVIPSFPTGREVPVAGGLKVGEQSFEFELTPEDAGQVDVPVRFDRPGRYDVVALALDGRGREVRAEAVFWVTAGGDFDHDGESIRVLPDADEYPPGDKARVLVLLPRGLEDAALLETVEGTALGTHAVEEARGRSHVFEVPVPEKLGTRVVFAVAAVRGNRVQRGSAAVRVPPRESLLSVIIHAEPEEVRPGETIEAVVELRDPDWEPVEAEASLAVIDDSIMALYPEGAPPIEEFFFGRTRHDVATDSSRTGLFLGRAPPLAGGEADGPPGAPPRGGV
ncbi:MAG: MG2 domain-containing protein, partial [Planctomycetota bacterium]